MRRKVWLFLAFGLLLPLVAAGSASAQGSTLTVSNSTPRPGDVITINGSGFTSTSGFSPVAIRLNTRNAPVLVNPTPDSAGRISATLPVPTRLAPGWYLILATQSTTANGRARSFTPGRTRIRVRAPGASRSGAAPGGGGSPGSPLGLAALGSALLLLAGGATIAARRHRPRPQIGG